MKDNRDRLLLGLKNGDKLIFEEVYREYFIPLCYYCLKYVENIEDSEEIVQELFLKLWDKHDKLEIKSSLNAYLYRAVKNYALNFLSKEKTKEKYFVTPVQSSHCTYDNGLMRLEEDELRSILKLAILNLPEKRRRIFELSRFEGLKYSKIASHLSISVKTVEAQMTKSLKYLRVILKEYAPVLIFVIMHL